MRPRARAASACRPRSGRSRRWRRLLVGDRPLPGDRRRRPPARPRPRARAARGRARGGRVGRADGRRARPHRRARAASTAPRSCSSTPAGWPSASRTSSASGSATTSSPRTTAACPRSAATGSRRRLRAGDLQGARRHRVARARHRHRPGRARVPDRLAPQHRHVPAARRPLEPQPRGHAEGPAVPADPRRAGRVRRAARRGARRPPRRDRSPPRLPLDILAQQIVAEVAAQEWRTDDLFDARAPGRAVHRARPRAQFDEVRRRSWPTASRPAAAGGAPTCTTTRSTASCAARKGARLAAVTSGGAIPEIGDYRVRRRARRHVHRHRQRGLGRRVDGRRHLPARHPLVADPPGRARRRCACATPATRRRPSRSGWARRRPAPPSCRPRCPTLRGTGRRAPRRRRPRRRAARGCVERAGHRRRRRPR